MIGSFERIARTGLASGDKKYWERLLQDDGPEEWAHAVAWAFEWRMLKEPKLRVLVAALDLRDDRGDRVAMLTATQEMSATLRKIAVSLTTIAAALTGLVNWL